MSTAKPCSCPLNKRSSHCLQHGEHCLCYWGSSEGDCPHHDLPEIFITLEEYQDGEEKKRIEKEQEGRIFKIVTFWECTDCRGLLPKIDAQMPICPNCQPPEPLRLTSEEWKADHQKWYQESRHRSILVVNKDGSLVMSLGYHPSLSMRSIGGM